MNPATLLSITAVADLFGRILCGLVIDSMDVPMHATYGGALLITAGSILALPAAQVIILQAESKNSSVSIGSGRSNSDNFCMKTTN